MRIDTSLGAALSPVSSLGLEGRPGPAKHVGLRLALHSIFPFIFCWIWPVVDAIQM